MLRQALVAVVILVVSAVAPAYAQEVKLQWKFKEGDTFWVEEVSSTKTTVSVAGTPLVKSEEKTTSLTSFTVKKVAGDSVVVEMKKEDVVARSDSPLGEMTAKIAEKIKGATFTVTLTPSGKVTKFE